MFDLFDGASRALWSPRKPQVLRSFLPGQERIAPLVATFEQALAGVESPASLKLRARIRSAKTKVDLWYLRSEVFDIVSHALGQWEAQNRLSELNELFESSGPRTGPIPL